MLAVLLGALTGPDSGHHQAAGVSPSFSTTSWPALGTLAPERVVGSGLKTGDLI